MEIDADEQIFITTPFYSFLSFLQNSVFQTIKQDSLKIVLLNPPFSITG